MLEQISDACVKLCLPSGLALWLVPYLHWTPKQLANCGLGLLVVALLLPAALVDERLYFGWQAAGLSFSPVILFPPGLLSAIANLLFLANYIALLCRSNKFRYFAYAAPVFALLASVAVLFSSVEGLFEYVFEYQSDNRIGVGAGVWLCAHVLLILAYRRETSLPKPTRGLHLISTIVLIALGSLVVADVVAARNSSVKQVSQKIAYVEFLPEGDRLVTHHRWSRGGMYNLEVQARVLVWNLADRSPTFSFPLETKFPSCMRLSPLAGVLAYADFDRPNGIILLADVHSGRTLGRLEGHQAEILELAFSGDGSRLVSASRDGTVRIWDWAKGVELSKFQHSDQVLSVALNTEGTQLIFFSADGSVSLVANLEAQPERAFLQHANDLSSSAHVAFSPDGQWAVVGHWNGTLHWWNLQQEVAEVEIVTTTADILRVTDVDFSPDGSLLALSNYEGLVQVWSVATKSLAHQLQHPVEVHSVAFSPENRLLATGEGGAWSFEQAEAIRLWNVQTGTVEVQLPLPPWPEQEE